MESESIDLRQRTVNALLDMAALERDPGAVGHAEGMAMNFLSETGAGRKLDEAYTARIEASVAAARPRVREVIVHGSTVRAVFHDGLHGWSVIYASPAAAVAAAERLRP